MSTDDRIDALLRAESDIAIGVESFVRVLGVDRAREVVAEIVRNRMRSLEVRRQVVTSIAVMDATPCN